MKKTKQIKKMIITTICVVLAALGLTGCGFSVGNTSNDGADGYKDVFPDRAAKLGSNYKTSDLAYDFTLGEYGGMKIYVDTSEGHKFEVDSENGGFSIQDADGNEVLHAYGLAPETYASITADYSEVKKINNRDFFYALDGNYYHALSYMADCGLDCGMILEATTEDAFEYVAFRGKAIEGASDNIYDYQGKKDDAQVQTGNDNSFEEGTPEDDEADTVTTGKTAETVDGEETEEKASGTSTCNSLLSDDLEKRITSLDTDYNKVSWGVRYSLNDSFESFVISAVPYYSMGEYYLVVAFTNMYDEEVCFSGSAKALGDNDEEIGDTFVYTGAIGPGNTVLEQISCGENIPDGRIRWEDCELDGDPAGTYIPWEADYSASADEEMGEIKLNYVFYSANSEEIVPGNIDFLVLDEKGYILGKGVDFSSDVVAADDKYEGTASCFVDDYTKMKDIAMFATSVK